MILILLRVSLFLLLLVQSVCNKHGTRQSSIRSDMKVLMRYNKLDVTLFLDTCMENNDFEKAVIGLFPAAEVIRLTHGDLAKIRTEGKVFRAVLGETTGKKIAVSRVVDESKSEEGEDGELNLVKGEVTVVSLDDLLAQEGFTACPEVIRIVDYLGYELDVLKGMEKTLKCVKVLFVTGHVLRPNDKKTPFASEIISFLDSNGFSIYNTYENQRARFFNVQIDMLFVRKEMLDEMYEVGFKDYL